MALLVVGLSLLATAQFARHRGDRTRDQPPTRTAHRYGSGGARDARATGRKETDAERKAPAAGCAAGAIVREGRNREGEEARFHRFGVRGGSLASPGPVRFDAYHSPLQSTPAWAKPNHGFFHCQHPSTRDVTAFDPVRAGMMHPPPRLSRPAMRTRRGCWVRRTTGNSCFQAVCCIGLHVRAGCAGTVHVSRARRCTRCGCSRARLRKQSSTHVDSASHKSDCAETARTPETRMPAVRRHSSACVAGAKRLRAPGPVLRLLVDERGVVVGAEHLAERIQVVGLHHEDPAFAVGVLVDRLRLV